MKNYFVNTIDFIANKVGGPSVYTNQFRNQGFIYD